MATIVSLLLTLVSINPVINEPTIYVDGYIEINHFWGEDNGKLIFDQILVWKYDELINDFRIVHWEMIKDGRELSRIWPSNYEPHFKRMLWFLPDEISITLSTMLANHERDRIKREIEIERFLLKKQNAKNLDSKPEDIVVFIDSKWVGGRYYCRADYRHDIEMYETKFRINDQTLTIRTKHSYESNTLFDPETQYKVKYDAPHGSTRMLQLPIIKKK